MENLFSSVDTRTINNVSLAYFADDQGVCDSVRDLCTAGFQASGINISQSMSDQKTRHSAEENDPLAIVFGAHSKLWSWKRINAHDRHRRGADQISGLDRTPLVEANPACFSFDLQAALDALHVPADVITLLLQDVQQRGVFLMVDASDRVQEADRILDRNAGYLRTQYLTGLPS